MVIKCVIYTQTILSNFIEKNIVLCYSQLDASNPNTTKNRWDVYPGYWYGSWSDIIKYVVLNLRISILLHNSWLGHSVHTFIFVLGNNQYGHTHLLTLYYTSTVRQYQYQYINCLQYFSMKYQVEWFRIFRKSWRNVLVHDIWTAYL